MLFFSKAELQEDFESGMLSESQYSELMGLLRDVGQTDSSEWQIEMEEDGSLAWKRKSTSTCDEAEEPNDMVTNDIVGENLKRWRVYNGYSQLQIAEHIHCAQQTYQKYEKGTRAIPIDSLARIARLYRTSIESLVYPPRGLRDMPQYKPYSKASGHIWLAHAAKCWGKTAIIDNVFEVATYDKLYSVLDGRNRTYSPVGIAKATDGTPVLLVKQAGRLYEADKLGDEGMSVEEADHFAECDYPAYEAWMEEQEDREYYLHCHFEELMDTVEPADTVSLAGESEQVVTYEENPSERAVNAYGTRCSEIYRENKAKREQEKSE